MGCCSRSSKQQLFGAFGEDRRAAGALDGSGDGGGGGVGGKRLLHPHTPPHPEQSWNHSGLDVTAPRSNWPATLRSLEEGGAGLCDAAMATGPFNESEHAVTNDIPEPIGYTANEQFAASLTVLHNSKQAERTHLSGRSPTGRQIDRRQADGVIDAKANATSDSSKPELLAPPPWLQAQDAQEHPGCHHRGDIRHIIHNRGI